MVICDILLILQYQVSTTVMVLVVVFALFVFMLETVCFCVAAVFSANKDLYNNLDSCVLSSCVLRYRMRKISTRKKPRKFAETTRQWITRLVVITVKCMELNEM